MLSIYSNSYNRLRFTIGLKAISHIMHLRIHFNIRMALAHAQNKLLCFVLNYFYNFVSDLALVVTAESRQTTDFDSSLLQSVQQCNTLSSHSDDSLSQEVMNHTRYTTPSVHKQKCAMST